MSNCVIITFLIYHPCKVSTWINNNLWLPSLTTNKHFFPNFKLLHFLNFFLYRPYYLDCGSNSLVKFSSAMSTAVRSSKLHIKSAGGQFVLSCGAIRYDGKNFNIFCVIVLFSFIILYEVFFEILNCPFMWTIICRFIWG